MGSFIWFKGFVSPPVKGSIWQPIQLVTWIWLNTLLSKAIWEVIPRPIWQMSTMGGFAVWHQMHASFRAYWVTQCAGWQV
jgi:hypothetical protein